MTRANISIAVLLCTIWTGLAVEAAEQARRPINSYIVQVAENFDPTQVGRAIAQRTQGGLGHVYTRAMRGFSIQLPPGLARQVIESEPGVLKVEADIRTYATGQTLPTGVNRIDVDQNALAAIDGVDIDADRINVDVAILDTGIDTDHPDLRVVGGTHFYTVLLFGFFPVGYQDNNYDDDNGHGTHCAGIAAAIDNNTGVVGVAPGARLWAVKVLGSDGSGYVSDLIAGIDWVAANPSIKVANMSLAATGQIDQLRTAIQNCVNQGVVFVAAAGNAATDIYGADGVFPSSDDTIPAAYPEVAAISALADSDGLPGGAGSGGTAYGPDDSFATFSNYSRSVVTGNPVNSPGRGIDLLMPGVSIESCWPGGGTHVASGTSMASPHGAGLAALYIAANGAASNATGVYAIRQALIDAGKDQASGLRLAVAASEPDTAPENLGWAGDVQTDPVTDVAIASVSAPATAVQGQTVSIDVVVRNVGNQDIVAGTPVILTDAVYGEIGRETHEGGLAAGASTTVTFSWVTSQATAPGAHELVASHDLADDNAANDSASTSVQIVEVLTDIAITSVEAPPSAVLGSPIDVVVTVSNAGNQDISTDIPVTLDDTTVDPTVTIGEQTVIGGLEPGESVTLTFTWDTTGASPGLCTLTAGHSMSDDVPGNDTASAAVEITEQSAQPVAYVTVTVRSWIPVRPNTWRAYATVMVQADDGQLSSPLMYYATVSGEWTGAYKARVIGSTDDSGLELFETRSLRKPGTVTFTVTEILDSEGRECELQGALSGSYTGP